MDEVAVYLAFSGAMGLLQMRDNYKLYGNSGNPEKCDTSFSLLVLSWFFVSVAILVSSDLQKLEALVPVIFILFNIVGWFYGYILYINNKNNGANIVISPNYLIGCIIFGVIYSLLPWSILYQHYNI